MAQSTLMNFSKQQPQPDQTAATDEPSVITNQTNNYNKQLSTTPVDVTRPFVPKPPSPTSSVLYIIMFYNNNAPVPYHRSPMIHRSTCAVRLRFLPWTTRTASLDAFGLFAVTARIIARTAPHRVLLPATRSTDTQHRQPLKTNLRVSFGY